MNLREAQAYGYSTLYANKVLRDFALWDAKQLLMHTLQISRAQLLAHHEDVLTPGQQESYQALIYRRLNHEPIQYIVGAWEFYGLEFALTPAVLIPRPATEGLIEAVLSELQPEAVAAGRPLRIVDVGTGSGIIAVSLAVHLPTAQITALDLSPGALEVAAANASRHRVADRIRFLQSDLLAGLPSGEPRYDAVVANLPYIPQVDSARLHPQVRDHEPHLALFGGPDGLDLYRRFLPQARAALKPNGLLGLEMGYKHDAAITELLAGWNHFHIVPDLEGIPRAALARNP
jgi:release factor glutamine methyltransferase